MKNTVKNLLRKILPSFLFNKLKSIGLNYFSGYSLKSYSQEGEDMILQRIFNNKSDGFYVDIGAHHPKRFSNTYFFYLKGWKGINIDAMPGSMKPFRKTRPRDTNLEIPISEKKEKIKFYIFNEPALNGFSKDLSISRNGLHNQYKIIDEKELETETLKSVLNKYLPKDQKINFMSIDVEGLDLQVLKSNDWERYRPEILLVEVLESSIENIMTNKVTKYLNSVNYFPYAKSVNTVFFKHRK